MSKNLLMIHGIGCGGGVWNRMRPEFEAAGWACDTPTLFADKRVRRSPPPSLPDLRFEDYVDTMETTANEMTAEHGEKPAVIGHSMGGLIAQCLAERGAVSKAVFLTPAQPKECAVVSFSVLWTFANVVAARNREKGYKIWRTGFGYGVLNRVPKRRHDEIYADALYDSGKVYGDMTDGILVDETKVNIPTLTIAATKDRATVAKGVRKVGAKYAKSPVPGDFLEYEFNAHWIVDEPGTEKVTADILNWLNTNEVTA